MMRPIHVLLVAGAALAIAGLLSCGGNGNPTQPPTNPPTTTTTTLPSPGSCNPTPPPLYRINVKIHDNGNGNRRVLDSRPVVVDMNGYCEAHGMGSGFYCFTSREGAPDSAACDKMAVGMADTGRWGPTWKYQVDRGSAAQPCSSEANPGCINHADNQFLVIAKGQGVFQACAHPSIPLSTVPGYEGGRCGFCVLKAGDEECH
jgi:hypothetical protein